MRRLIRSGWAAVRSSEGRSIGLGFADQSFSSATNFGLSVAAGRILGPSGLGGVFLGFSVYLMCVVLQRRLVSEPLTASSATADPGRRRETAGYALTLSIAIGTFSSVATAVVGLLIPGVAGRGVFAMAPWLTLALVQDCMRSILFRDGRSVAATVNDGLWLLVMAICIVPAWFVGSPAAVVASWGLGALAGAVVGIVQVAVRPQRPGSAWSWWRRDAMPFGKWNAGSAVIENVVGHLGAFLLTAVIGARSLGGLRAVQSIFAPLTLVIPAIEFPGLPIVSRALAVGEREARRVSLQLSGLAFVACSLYLLLLVAVGSDVLPFLFGSSFSGYRELILPIAIGQLLAACGVGLVVLLKAAGRGRPLLLSRSIGAVFTLAVELLLAWRYGLIGAAWGLTLGAAASTTILAGIALRGRSVDSRTVSIVA